MDRTKLCKLTSATKPNVSNACKEKDTAGSEVNFDPADDMAAKRQAFLKAIDRLLPLSESRRHTAAEVLIRQDRDSGHRDVI